MPTLSFYIQNDIYLKLIQEKNKSTLINNLLKKHFSENNIKYSFKGDK